MIDLHFHCLPGIDDGPKTWDEAVALCRAAAAQGTTDIIATPHVLRDPWLNESRADRDALIAELNDRLGGEPAIHAGCEFFFAADAYELWQMGADGPLVGLNGSMSLLIEFPATSIPREARAVLHELVVAGVTPVIAHPERNLVFASDPAALQRLVDQGAQSQITAASLTGHFGKAAEDAATRLIDLGLGHVVASDAHSRTRRPPALAAARQVIEEKWGYERAVLLTDTAPRAICGL